MQNIGILTKQNSKIVCLDDIMLLRSHTFCACNKTLLTLYLHSVHVSECALNFLSPVRCGALTVCC